MLSKCSNPSCSALFYNLKNGKLFLLERDPLAGPTKSNHAEYFWLCHECSSTMTLHLTDRGHVVPAVLPPVMRQKPADIVVHARDRRAGLLLHEVSAPRQELGGGRKRGKRLRFIDPAA